MERILSQGTGKGGDDKQDPAVAVSKSRTSLTRYANSASGSNATVYEHI